MSQAKAYTLAEGVTDYTRAVQSEDDHVTLSRGEDGKSSVFVTDNEVTQAELDACEHLVETSVPKLTKAEAAEAAEAAANAEAAEAAAKAEAAEAAAKAETPGGES